MCTALSSLHRSRAPVPPPPPTVAPTRVPTVHSFPRGPAPPAPPPPRHTTTRLDRAGCDRKRQTGPPPAPPPPPPCGPARPGNAPLREAAPFQERKNTAPWGDACSAEPFCARGRSSVPNHPYKVDTSRPSPRTNWTRLVPVRCPTTRGRTPKRSSGRRTASTTSPRSAPHPAPAPFSAPAFVITPKERCPSLRAPRAIVRRFSTRWSRSRSARAPLRRCAARAARSAQSTAGGELSGPAAGPCRCTALGSRARTVASPSRLACPPACLMSRSNGHTVERAVGGKVGVGGWGGGGQRGPGPRPSGKTRSAAATGSPRS